MIFISPYDHNDIYKQVFKTIELLGKDYASKCLHVSYSPSLSRTATARKGYLYFPEIFSLGKSFVERSFGLGNHSKATTDSHAAKEAEIELVETLALQTIIAYMWNHRRCLDARMDWSALYSTKVFNIIKTLK